MSDGFPDANSFIYGDSESSAKGCGSAIIIFEQVFASVDIAFAAAFGMPIGVTCD